MFLPFPEPGKMNRSGTFKSSTSSSLKTNDRQVTPKKRLNHFVNFDTLRALISKITAENE